MMSPEFTINLEGPGAASDGAVFVTTLRKPAGGKLGFAGMPATVCGHSSIHVRSIASGGAIDIYNRTCAPGKVIRHGDHIVRIGNSSMDPHDMMEQLVAAAQIELCILREGGAGAGLDSGLQGRKEIFAADPRYDPSEASTVAPASNYQSLESNASRARSVDDLVRVGFAAPVGLPAAPRFAPAPSASRPPASSYPSPNASAGEARSLDDILSRFPVSFTAEVGRSADDLFDSAPSAPPAPASNYQSLGSNMGEASFAAPVALPAAQSCASAPSVASPSTVDSLTNLGRKASITSAGSEAPEAAPGDTTVLLRQLPVKMSREMLLRLLDREGFAGLYDFVYLPQKFGTQKGFSYAFVNLVTPDIAKACHAALDGYSSWEIPHKKALVAAWANSEQGLEENIERYRNSPVMHESVPDESKPVLFKDGLRIPFPPPTKTLHAPLAQKKAAKAAAEAALEMSETLEGKVAQLPTPAVAQLAPESAPKQAFARPAAEVFYFSV